MAFRFRYLAPAELCLIGITGHFSLEDYAGIARAISDAKVAPGADSLVVLDPDADFSAVTPNLGEQQAKAIVARGKMNAPSRRAAYVCCNDMQVTITKLFAAYVSANAEGTMEVDVFALLDRATDWVEASKPGRVLDRARILSAFREMGQGW